MSLAGSTRVRRGADGIVAPASRLPGGEMSEILVLYYSATGSVRTLAQAVARGVESVEAMRARVRTVPKVASVVDKVVAAIPSEGPPYVEAHDLAECAGLALGSP